MFRWAVSEEQLAQHMQHVLAVEPAPDMNGQAFTGKFVDDGQHAECLAIMGAIHDEIVAPDVVSVCRPQPDARSVIQPQPASFRLFVRNLEPFAPPDALYPFETDGPAILLKQPVDTSVAITPETGSQANDRPCQDILIGPASWQLALRRSMLTEHRTGTALGYLQFADNMINTTTAA